MTTILLILSVTLNIIYYTIHRQQAKALESVTSDHIHKVRRLKDETEAQLKKIRSNEAYEPKKASFLFD